MTYPPPRNLQVRLQTFRGHSPFEIRVMGRYKLCRRSKFLDKPYPDCPTFWTPMGESTGGSLHKSLWRRRSGESGRLELALHIGDGGRRQMLGAFVARRAGGFLHVSFPSLERIALARRALPDCPLVDRPGPGNCGCRLPCCQEGAISGIGFSPHGAGDKYDLLGRGDRRVGDESRCLSACSQRAT